MRIIAGVLYKEGVKRQWGRASTHVPLSHACWHSWSLWLQVTSPKGHWSEWLL